MDLVEAVFARLAPQLRRFTDVLAVLCGGNRRQACTFANVVTSASSPAGPVLLLSPMFQRVYSCGAEACMREVEARRLEHTRWKARVAEAWDSLAACHNCFHLVIEDRAIRYFPFNVTFCNDSLKLTCSKENRQVQAVWREALLQQGLQA